MAVEATGRRFSVSGAVAGAIGLFILVLPFLIFGVFVGLPRDLPERALVAPAPQAPAALLHPAVRVIADERYERGGPDAVVEFAGSLSDDALKDGCLLALIRFELGLEESFEEALSSPEIGAPMNVMYPLPPIPMALPYGARMYPGNEAPQAPPLPGDEAGRPAAPGGRLSRPSASRAPRTTGEGPDLREAGDAGTSGEEGRPIGREQIAGAFAVMEKISSPHMRDGALRTIFEAIEEAGPGGLLDETLVDGAIAQLNSSYELANPYTTDPVDNIILGDIAADEYRSLRASGADPALIPSLLDGRLKAAYEQIADTKDRSKYARVMHMPLEVARSIETQQEILKEQSRDRDARWWAFLTTLGASLITAVGFVGGGLLGPVLKASGDLAARRVTSRLEGEGREAAP